jgi:hypothetical protein
MVNMRIMIITISLIHKNQNSNDKKFQGIGIWVIFWNQLYGPPWEFQRHFLSYGHPWTSIYENS